MCAKSFSRFSCKQTEKANRRQTEITVEKKKKKKKNEDGLRVRKKKFKIKKISLLDIKSEIAKRLICLKTNINCVMKEKKEKKPKPEALK